MKQVVSSQRSSTLSDTELSKIRELLFLNITIPIEIIKRILIRIELEQAEDLSTYILKLRKKLKDGLRYEKEIIEKSDVARDGLAVRAQQRIDEWSNECGKVQLKDILKMANHFGVPLAEILDASYITPNAIKEALSNFVIGQDEYLSKLSLAFYMHYLRTQKEKNNKCLLPRANLLVYGPTGTGKTFAIETLAKLFSLPVGIVNCNSLVSEGIMGQQITDVFTDLYIKNNKNIEELEHSIVFFDEFDKLLESGYYNERIINEILNIVDDNGSVLFNTTRGNIHYEHLRVSTNNMFFIFTGVFGGLEKIVKQRLNGGVGYSSQLNRTQISDFYDRVRLDDFKTLNIKPEILGRIHDFAHVKELTSEAIQDIIMVSKESPIREYQEYFSQHGVLLELKNDGAKELADYTVKKKLGARGVKSLMWQILSQEMTNVEKGGKKKKRLILDREYINKKLPL